MVRGFGVQDAVHRQIEKGVIDRQTGQACAGQRDPVIALLAADDLLLLGPADRIIVIADQLDLRVVGVRAGAAEQDLAGVQRRQFLQFLRQIDRRFMAASAEHVGVGDRFHLLARRLGQLLHAMPQRRAPEAGQPLDIFLALIVLYEHALALRHDQRTVGVQGLEIGGRVQDRGDVPRLDRIGNGGHVSLLKGLASGVARDPAHAPE